MHRFPRVGTPLVLLLAMGGAQAADVNRLQLDVTETAGVHRDHAPVHVLLTLPHPVPTSTPFRLTLDDQPVVAQFRPQGNAPDASQWWLDFLAASAPYEQRRYVVEFGGTVEPVPERTSGHQLRETDSGFVISNEPYISWSIPRDFRGFLSSVNFPPSEHLRPGALGLSITDRDGTLHQLGGDHTRAQVVRHGRMAVALRFETSHSVAALRDVSWTADLTFPGPISWVDLQLSIADPHNLVSEAELQLNLNLDKPEPAQRTIVELGADRTVYRSLFGKSQVVLEARADGDPKWQVLRTTSHGLQPFVVSARHSGSAEGWAYVMDRRRCLAIAFDRFGRQGQDRISVRADGHLTATKRFSMNAATGDRTTKHWRAWLHFVHFPPQQSAATDPQMMQNPLLVRQLAP